MKTSIFITLVLITSLSFGQNWSNNNMQTTVTEIVNYPENLELNQKNNYALVNFSVNKLGVVKVNNINASKELKAYVLEKLNGYKLINSRGFCHQNYQYKLSFSK